MPDPDYPIIRAEIARTTHDYRLRPILAKKLQYL